MAETSTMTAADPVPDAPGPDPSGAHRHARSRPWRGLAAAGGLYLVLALVVWWNVWSSHPTSTTTCGCGDSALFIWFFAWPAHALAHGLDPFFSTAMNYPHGTNLLANTSELGLGIVLAPVTWVFGPVASMNVALTLAPALSALAMFALVRRWVSWAPAAFAAGLFFGFSPMVLVSLSDAHLMDGFLAVPPLLLLCADELLFTRRRGPVAVGAALGLLVVVQFFIGLELLVILAICGAAGAVMMAAYGLFHLDRVRPHVRRVVVGLATGAAVAGVVLAYPAWYALAGPGHTSGRVWPTLDLGFEGASATSYVFPAPPPAGYYLFSHRIGGYQGLTLSDQYVGLGMVLVAVVGLLVWRRDRRLWLFSAVAVVAGALSLGTSHTHWLPWALFAHLPLLQNVIPNRFDIVVFLCAAVLLGIVVGHAVDAVRSSTASSGDGPSRGRALRWAAPAVGTAVALAAVVPVAGFLRPMVPLVTRPVRLPTWFTTVAPRLPPRQVLLVFPVPYQLIESAMAWQAVADFPYAMVGGGGPTGAVQRAGAEEPGAIAIGRASFVFSDQELRPGDVAATRQALSAWRVTGAVLPDEPGLAPYDRVTSVAYTTAFLTAVTGEAPVRDHGSWVWVVRAADLPPGAGPPPARVNGCVGLGASGTPAAIRQVAACVLALG